MTKWRWNHQTGESYEVDDDAPPPPPMFQIMASREAYASPVTGEKVYGRKGRSRDMAQHGCVDYSDVPSQKQMNKERERAHDKAIDKAVNDAARTLHNGA